MSDPTPPSGAPDGGDPEALVQIAQRHRPPRSRAAGGGAGAAVATPPPAAALPAAEDAPPRPRRRGRALSTDTLAQERGGAARRAADERQEQAGRAPKPERPKPKRPSAAPPAHGWLARLGAWGIAACCAGMAVGMLTLDGLNAVPDPLPVTTVRIGYLPGPQLPISEILHWLDRFPAHDQLRQPNGWVLDQLAEYLRSLPAVAQVAQVRLVHGPGDHHHLHRELDIDLALRQPVMPTVLASGERGWVDAKGRLLPGILPGPARHRPMLRGVEGASHAAVLAALGAWSRLEGELDPGLVTDLVLNDQLDARGSRGLVLYTRLGNRLVWGDPGEERFGVSADDRARALIHTIRCQGDLSRVATINVRFTQPVYTLRP